MAGMKLETLITAIAGLSITLKNNKTLVIKEGDEIPEDATRLGGIMFPKPDGFITDVEVIPQTYGVDTGERIDVNYTLNYVFCDIPGGSNRTLGANYDSLLYDTVQIVNSILSNDTISDGIDLRLGGFDSFGLVYDPAGNAYYGTQIRLNVSEFYEV
jgi:hypothetical protein